MRLCASIPCMSVLTCVLWNLQLRNVAVSARGRAQYLEPRPYSASPVGTSFAQVGLEDPAAISCSTHGSDYECERHALFDGCGQVIRSQDPLTAIQAYMSYTMR